MKILLFVAFVLTLFSLLSIVLFNFVGIAFSWEDLKFYLVLAVIIYAILYLVGRASNGKFNKYIREFVENKRNNLLDDKGLLRTYGFLLITLLPFLIYLLLLSLYAALAVGLYGLITLFEADRVPIVIIIALAVISLGTGYAVLLGFYKLIFKPNPNLFGIELDFNKDKKFIEIVNEVAKDAGITEIDRVIISSDPGISVYLRSNLFSAIRGRGEKILTIGLPSIHGLNISEFKSILAHECGHFSNKDSRWTSFTYSMSHSLINAWKNMPGPYESKDEGWGIYRILVSLNPAYWIIYIFVKLYFRITNGFSRVREVLSDIASMNKYGGESFKNGLLKVATNDLVFNEYIYKNLVFDFLKDGKQITNFSFWMEYLYKNLDKDKVGDIQKEFLLNNIQSEYDSHPSLALRLEYANKFTSGEEKKSKKVEELFADWKDINSKVAEIFNERLLKLIEDYSRLQSQENVPQETKAATESAN